MKALANLTGLDVARHRYPNPPLLDGACRGLRLVASPPIGARRDRGSWVYRYRTREGRLRQIKLGEYPEMSLAEARKAWGNQKGVRDDLARGDPRECSLAVNEGLLPTAALSGYLGNSCGAFSERRSERHCALSAPTSAGQVALGQKLQNSFRLWPRPCRSRNPILRLPCVDRGTPIESKERCCPVASRRWASEASLRYCLPCTSAPQAPARTTKYGVLNPLGRVPGTASGVLGRQGARGRVVQ